MRAEKRTVMCGAILLLAVCLCLGPCWAGEPVPRTLELLSVGQPGPDAMGLTVSTDKEPDHRFKPRDHLILTVKAEERGYLTILAVSPDEVTVVFPNKETPDALIEKGKPYRLFGNDSRSRLKLGKEVKESKLVFYLTSRPPALQSLKSSGQSEGITLRLTDEEGITLLKKELESIAQAKGFNRVVISLQGEGGQSYQASVKKAKPMLRAPMRGPIEKKIPRSTESTPPETVTGVQGVKPEPVKKE